MPDYPPEMVTAAASAMCELHDLDAQWAETLARAVLDAALPLAAEVCAQAILKHMEGLPATDPVIRARYWRYGLMLSRRSSRSSRTRRS